MKKFLAILMILVSVLMFGCAKKAAALELPSTDFGTKGVLTVGLNDMQAGTYYDVKNKQVLAGAQVSAIDFKKLLSVDVGILTDAHSSPWMVGLGVDVMTLANMLNLNYNLPGALHLGAWVSKDISVDWETGGRWGFSAVARF